MFDGLCDEGELRRSACQQTQRFPTTQDHLFVSRLPAAFLQPHENHSVRLRLSKCDATRTHASQAMRALAFLNRQEVEVHWRRSVQTWVPCVRAEVVFWGEEVFCRSRLRKSSQAWGGVLIFSSLSESLCLTCQACNGQSV